MISFFYVPQSWPASQAIRWAQERAKAVSPMWAIRYFPKFNAVAVLIPQIKTLSWP